MKKFLITCSLMLLACFPFFAQNTNNIVLLGVGLDTRLGFLRIAGSGASYTLAPKISESMQIKGNAVLLSMMVYNKRIKLMYGIEYACRYDHLYFKETYPDTTMPGMYITHDPVNGFLTDYLYFIKKKFSIKNVDLLAEAGLGFMNRGSQYYTSYYASTNSAGYIIQYGQNRNTFFKSYIAGISFQKEWLYLSFRGHLVLKKMHQYDRLPTFTIFSLVAQYQIPLSLKPKDK